MTRNSIATLGGLPRRLAHPLRLRAAIDAASLPQLSETERPIVALLEARMSNELARLVEKHGGAAAQRARGARGRAGAGHGRGRNSCSPSSASRRHEVVIFLTGVAVSLLFELAEQLGQRGELVGALRQVTTVCRGPKPTAALRGFGVPPTLTAREPFTAAELIDALADMRSPAGACCCSTTASAARRCPRPCSRAAPSCKSSGCTAGRCRSTRAARARWCARIVHGDVDALAVTCQIQFRHLYQVAERIELQQELVLALNDRVVVGAVGPTCRAILEAYGVRRSVMPEHPKMGPLVIAMMRHLDQHGRSAARRTRAARATTRFSSSAATVTPPGSDLA